MNCDQLIKTIGEIDERYILEYDAAVIKGQGLKKTFLKKHWTIAASIALAFAAMISFISSSTGSGNNTLEFTNHYFESRQEFISILPENALLKNITESDNRAFQYIGVCEGGGMEDHFTTETFSSFDVVIYEDGKVLADISFIPDSKESAAKYAANHELTLNEIINDTTVWYSCLSDEEYYFEAVFMFENDLYLIHCYSPAEADILDILNGLLE